MIKQYQVSDINDDTKIVRFLDLYGAEKSIGLMNRRDIECNFHYGVLHQYQTLETIAGDTREGSVSIQLNNGLVVSDATTNNALVSCWSIWDGKNNPWLSLKDSAFAKDPKNVCVIVSTVGKVRKIFQQTIELCKLLLGKNFPQIVLKTIDRPVIYYPREAGVPQQYWEEITDVKQHGLIARTLHDIFHKRDSNEKGQSYGAEHEYRFAMLLGNRHFFGSNKDIALSAEDAIWRDYPLILKDGAHFIETVYLRDDHPNIEATCYFSGIDLAKNNISIFVKDNDNLVVTE